MIGLYLGKRLDPKRPWLGILRLVVSIPMIYAVAAPILLLDLIITLYQKVCFPLFGIPVVHRSVYVQFRRMQVDGLNVFDQLNCHYCAYANGVLHYAQKVAGETERMWCPIRHHARRRYAEPPHHGDFVNGGGREEMIRYYDRYLDSRRPPCDED